MSWRRLNAARIRLLRKAYGNDQNDNASITKGRLDQLLQQLLESRGTLSIVQVGANDGRLNDPINPFIRRHPGETRLLLIEPQPQVLPALRETYADHPATTIVQCAIGPSGETTLWQVDEHCWSDAQPSYATGSNWPDYRAPSGITSANRGHVESWIAKNYSGDLSLDEVITSFVMESRPLVEVLESSGFGFAIDLLQVDTEGADDIVIMNSSIATLRPALINFENMHLSHSRLEALSGHLVEHGYEITHQGFDTLAALNEF